ncbi:MAG: TIGR03915 family putative DNA repair protein [Candidatus Merdivicinus sp.]|jgi:probable DNA metabolism protein
MSDRRIMIQYQYDGSFDGMLCCIFESFVRKEIPLDICTDQSVQTSLYPVRIIETIPHHARRVFVSIPQKISPLALDWVRKAFLSCHPHKEMLILEFLRKAYPKGPSILRMLQDDTIASLFQIVQAIDNESHLLKGFIRFVERNGVLTSVITPKNQVLPLIARHFAERLPQETFLIYDQAHDMALFHQNGHLQIFPAGNIEFAPESPQEVTYQLLWKRFYQTIAIEGRENPKCRMTHCPKRYWQNMTELCDQIFVNSVQKHLKNSTSSAIMKKDSMRQLTAGKVEVYDLHVENRRASNSGEHSGSGVAECPNYRRF